jgi:hypothetical protein
MTGRAPVPVPTTSRRHFQGIFSSTERRVAEFTAKFFGRFLLALADLPSINHDVVLVRGLCKIVQELSSSEVT